jgi:hypothetical protein
MKKYGLLIAFFLLGFVATAQNTSHLIFSLSPYCGFYQYSVTSGSSAVYTGGLNIIDVEYEYRFLDDLGVFAFLQGTGHLYENHELSSSPVSVIWGLINTKLGGGFSWYLNPFDRISVRLAAGISSGLYIQDSDEILSGFSLNGIVSVTYPVSPRWAVGLGLLMNYSWYSGAAMVGPTRLPFEIIELGGALTASYHL